MSNSKLEAEPFRLKVSELRSQRPTTNFNIDLKTRLAFERRLVLDGLSQLVLCGQNGISTNEEHDL